MKNDYGLNDHVFFLGNTFSKERLLSAMKIGVITSDSEGLSNAIMEYMASGVPAIASNVPGNRELIRDNENGCLFDNGNAKDLADIISYLMYNRDRAEEFARQASQNILNFDWSYRIEEILDYYRGLINRKS
jgi:glycosyltransferase involved in cell wall biosynthesis